MEKTLLYPFGKVTINDYYIVSELNEGILVSDNMNQILVDLGAKYFPEKPVIYISNRIHSYTVDPKVYIKTSQIKNLAGIAIVRKNNTIIDNSDIEKLFASIPFEVFDTMKDAKKWAEMIYKNKLNDFI